MINTFLAKSNPPQTIEEHTKRVITSMFNVLKVNEIHFAPKDEDKKKKFYLECALTAILHDIGKFSPEFQKRLEEKTEQEFWHNVLSWAWAIVYINKMERDEYHDIRSTILYHHVVDYKKYDGDNGRAYTIIKDFEEKYGYVTQNMFDFYENMCAWVKKEYGIDILENPHFELLSKEDRNNSHLRIDDDTLYNIGDNDREIQENGPLMRAVFMSCDRDIVNNLSDINDVSVREYVTKHQKILSLRTPDTSGYDQERLATQKKMCDKIVSNRTTCIAAPPGFGKTLIGFLTAIEKGTKTFWVVPKRVIADNTYASIMAEVKQTNMDIKVGLFYNNRMQSGPDSVEDCDIVVCIIDAFLSQYSHNNKAHLLYGAYFNTVIFDEFHQFFCGEPMFAAFSNLLRIRNNYTYATTILLSATKYDLNPYIHPTDKSRQIIEIPSNECKVVGGDVKINIKVIEVQEYVEPDGIGPNTFTVLPYVKHAQNTYENYEDEAVIFHSLFNKTDIEEKRELLVDHYGKNPINEDKPAVIATNIITTGVDISAKNGIIYPSCIEELVQFGVGRLSRFGEYPEVNLSIYVISPYTKFYKNPFYQLYASKNKQKDNKQKGVGGKYLEVYKKFAQFILSKDGTTMTKAEFCQLLDEFYDKSTYDCLKSYHKALHTESIKKLTQIKYKSGRNNPDDEREYTSKGMGYRGDGLSVFVTVMQSDGSPVEPFTVSDNIIEHEATLEDTKSKKTRYRFMTSENNAFSYPSNYIKCKYKKYGMVSVEDACGLAHTNDTPLLLTTYTYDSEVGLKEIN